MPKMNGIDAARKIRDAETPEEHIAIIGLTAISKDKDAALFENADFDEILEKPISVDELLHEITYCAHMQKSSTTRYTSNNKSSNSLGIDRALSTTLNEMLLSELPMVKAKLQTAYDSGDNSLLRGEIHRLLGGIAYCNFADLQQLTLNFQTSLKNNSTGFADDFKKLITEIDRLILNGLS
jgi:CheY-like chemotaxis protein